MKELLNTVIHKIFIEDGEEHLQFETDKGIITFETDSDCCSETWFADIVGVANLLGQEVIAVEYVELDNYNVEDGRCRQEGDSVYCERLTTTKGTCDIIYRNSSNGYYGGDYSLEKNITELLPNTKEILEDWQA